MSFRPEEVSAVLAQELERYEAKLETKSVGTVLSVGDGIARVWGLEDAMAGELIRFPGDVTGMVLNLEEDNVGAVLFGSDKNIKEGDRVERTGRSAWVPAGKAMIGRVLNAIGQPVDGKGPIGADHFRNLEFTAPSVVERQPVKEPLQTGIKAIDSMIPIGRGQRELIIGDRQTGKTAIALDTIINQKGQDVVCIYVAIGQKESTVANVVAALQKYGAMEYTIVVTASASESAPLQYIAPYAGLAMGEEFTYKSGHVLCVYDDLSKHAQAYRQLSLLLRRPPGGARPSTSASLCRAWEATPRSRRCARWPGGCASTSPSTGRSRPSPSSARTSTRRPRRSSLAASAWSSCSSRTSTCRCRSSAR